MTLKQLMDLRGRRALVTGGGGHLGRQFAETLAELGADVILVDRAGSAIAQSAGELAEQWGVQVEHRFCDLEQEDERLALARWVGEDKRGLSILFNNAAFVGTTELAGWAVDFEAQSVEAWRRAIEVNLTAGFSLCRHLKPVMEASTGPSIINIASIYGTLGPDWSLYEGTAMKNPAAYSASKGGLIQLTRWLATTLAPRIRVNTISPGGIFRGQPEVFIKRYEARTPLGRMARELDFKGTAAYLASDLSAYVTGQNLMVDGGWSAW